MSPKIAFVESERPRRELSQAPTVGYNFSIVSDPDSGEMLKQISKRIDFTVSSAVNQGHPGNAPGAFPASGD